LRFIFFIIIVRPLILILFGVNMRNSHQLPRNGPAIIVANHNSHLDTLVLMSSFGFASLPNVRPVAAMDYWTSNSFLNWFSSQIVGIIPVVRGRSKEQADMDRKIGKDPLEGVYSWLESGGIVIFYPEGSRGEPEQLTPFKKGIAYLAEKYPHVPVVPIFFHGLGKILPRGEFLFTPFFIDCYIGEYIYYAGDKDQFMDTLTSSVQTLSRTGKFAEWE